VTKSGSRVRRSTNYLSCSVAELAEGVPSWQPRDP